jgi:hypothetical protein
VLASAASARRTDIAYGRLLTWAHASQVQVVYGGGAGAYYHAVASLPGVEAVGEVAYDGAVLPTAHGLSSQEVNAFSSPDNSVGVRTDRVKILAGRMWRAADPHAVMVDQQLAGRYHLRLGSTFRLAIVPATASTAMPQVLSPPFAADPFRALGLEPRPDLTDDQVHAA